MQKSIFIIISIFFCLRCEAQQTGIEWQKSFGGTSYDWTGSIQQTTDLGFIIAGMTSSNDGDVSGNHGYRDCWVVKITNDGVIEWQKTYGGTDADQANSIQQTIDGGYVFAGITQSLDGDVTGQHGAQDFWVVKLDSAGSIQWEKTLGGSLDDYATFVRQTFDHGFIVTGWSSSDDGDVTGHHSDRDVWLVKLDSTGSIEWQRIFGGTDVDAASTVLQTIEGGYILAGSTESTDGDIISQHGYGDVWVIKLTSTGSIEWQKTFGGSGPDWAHFIEQTSEGGYIIAGGTGSDDGDITFHHENIFISDCWILKIDNAGNIEWQKTFGGSEEEIAYEIRQVAEGGYVFTGYTRSNDGDIFGNHGEADFWIVKIDDAGNVEWQKALGGSDHDRSLALEKTSDGGYILSGYSHSNDSDITGHHGTSNYLDGWVVKLSSTIGVQEFKSLFRNIEVSPNPFSHSTNISFFLESPGNVIVKIIDPMARVIQTINYSFSNNGIQHIELNPQNKVSDGLYYLQLETDDQVMTKKIIVRN